MAFSFAARIAYTRSRMAVNVRARSRPRAATPPRRGPAEAPTASPRAALEPALAAPAAPVDRRERERAALLRAARRVFLRRGYSETRVEDVLRAARLSTRAFYRVHASKDELFVALFARSSA